MSDWVVEAVIQFVKSPLWTVPINNFIDDNCVVFADDEDGEMKFEYTNIFRQFQEIVDALLTSFIEELGVPAEEVMTACKNRMVAEQGLTKGKFVSEFMEYITCLDDFRSFKKVMEQRNVALELEAAKAYQQNLAAAATRPSADRPIESVTEPSATVESDEDRNLRLAIEASLAEVDIRQRTMQLEDAELQKALALSIAAEEERARAQQKFLEDCAMQAAASEEAARIASERARVEEERIRAIHNLETAAIVQRKENIAHHVASMATAPPDSPTDVSAAPVRQVAAAAVASISQASVPDVVHSTLGSSSSADHSSLAPIGGRKAPFGSFKALPSISLQQPTFKELSNEVIASSAPTRPSNAPAATQIVVNKQEATPEQLEQRANNMRELRQKLAQQKKAERATELEVYKTHVDSSTPPQASNAPVDETKRLTIEIARRLREDLVNESKRQQ